MWSAAYKIRRTVSILFDDQPTDYQYTSASVYAQGQAHLKSFELAKKKGPQRRALILTRDSYLCIILQEKNRKRGKDMTQEKRGKEFNVDVK